MDKVFVSEIQRFCVHDGPGIRTTVFFQGCPLKCKWCQNPETISLKPIIMYSRELCEGCGYCIEACPNKAISVNEDANLVTDRQLCNCCGECTNECYFLARKLSSKEMTVDEVYKTVMRDEVVYRNSGGGITISGGEPLLHVDFAYELLSRIHSEGISTAVETAGYVPWESIEKMAPVTSTFLFDMKLYTEELHKEWTGVSNKLILSNLKKLTDIHDNVVIRIPLIPGVNDSSEEFDKMMKFVKELRKINGVHILPFHQFGSNKYDLAGIPYALECLDEDNEEGVARCKAIAESYNLRVNVGGTGFVSDRIVDNSQN